MTSPEFPFNEHLNESRGESTDGETSSANYPDRFQQQIPVNMFRRDPYHSPPTGDPQRAMFMRQAQHDMMYVREPQHIMFAGYPQLEENTVCTSPSDFRDAQEEKVAYATMPSNMRRSRDFDIPFFCRDEETTSNLTRDDSIDIKSSPAYINRYLKRVPVKPSKLGQGNSDSQCMQAEEYLEPTDYDVLCGRGKGIYNKPGNRRFREIVATFADEYQNVSTKLDKSVILERVYDSVCEQNKGRTRFLKFNKKVNKWTEMTIDQAREKVGHAIREAISKQDQGSTKQGKKPKATPTGQDEMLEQQPPLFENMSPHDFPW